MRFSRDVVEATITMRSGQRITFQTDSITTSFRGAELTGLKWVGASPAVLWVEMNQVDTITTRRIWNWRRWFLAVGAASSKGE